MLHFLAALIYVVLHSLVLFNQMVTLNVALNSESGLLITVLVSNQFVELKGCVFKKYSKENLFQISCSGTVFHSSLPFRGAHLRSPSFSPQMLWSDFRYLYSSS